MEQQINLQEQQVRILCVDDERNVLRALQRIFLDDDYEIFTAESAEEGLTILEEEEDFQLVISDYRMPGQNGVDFLREVCRRRPETVRIVLSGYADAGAIVSAINEGQIYKFIPKPWNDDELKNTLDAALQLYFLQQRNRQLMTELQESNDKLQEMNENLEELVAERTQSLEFKNQALGISQNILDALPVAVIGFDVDGTIVKTNQALSEILGMPDQHLVGLPREDFLPDCLNRLVDESGDEGAGCRRIEIGGRKLLAWVSRMASGDQEGIILTLANGDCGS